jgi:hypothetical protein
MWKRFLGTVLLGGALLLSEGGCNGRPFAQVGPPITIPPPFGEPLFSLGAEAGTVLVSGSAALVDTPRPAAKVSVLNLELGVGSIVVTGDDALYLVTIPGTEGDLVEVTVEFEGQLFRSEFLIDLTP